MHDHVDNRSFSSVVMQTFRQSALIYVPSTSRNFFHQRQHKFEYMQRPPDETVCKLLPTNRDTQNKQSHCHFALRILIRQEA